MSQQNRCCEHCGKPLPEDARFCESCGHAAGVASASSAAPGIAITPCPRCAQADQADRAASAVERLRKMPDKDKPTDRELEQQSQREELIEALGKPEKPKPVSSFWWAFAVFIPILGLIIILMAPLRRGLKIFLAGIVLVFLAALVLHATNDVFYKSGAVYFLGLFMMVYYWAALWFSSFRHRAEFETRLKPEYDKALPRWGHLCYCQRCNVVYFDDAPSNDRRFVSALESQAFLRQ